MIVYDGSTATSYDLTVVYDGSDGPESAIRVTGLTPEQADNLDDILRSAGLHSSENGASPTFGPWPCYNLRGRE